MLLFTPYALHTSILSFFFNDPATTEIYTLSLHDALPISAADREMKPEEAARLLHAYVDRELDAAKSLELAVDVGVQRSEEHTSELQSHHDLVCRLLLEKKKKKKKN